MQETLLTASAPPTKPPRTEVIPEVLVSHDEAANGEDKDAAASNCGVLNGHVDDPDDLESIASSLDSRRASMVVMPPSHEVSAELLETLEVRDRDTNNMEDLTKVRDTWYFIVCVELCKRNILVLLC